MGKRKKGPKRQKPDDYFVAGPLEFARFGRLTIARSHVTEEGRVKATAAAAESLPQIMADIDLLVESIASRIARLPADRLLHRAWWEFAATMITRGVRETEHAGLMRMLDYVQSIIASTVPAPDQSAMLDDEEWGALQRDVEKLFHTLSLDYQWAKTASASLNDPNFDLEFEEFRFRAETMWMHVRGKRYHYHELQALAEILEPHSDELFKLFGIGSAQLVSEFGKILHSLSSGAIKSVKSAQQLHKDSMVRMNDLIDSGDIKTRDDIAPQLWADQEFAARRDEVIGLLHGTDLFDVEKVTALPKLLVDELTWDPGEDKSFFSSGPMKGWPLKEWPVMKRPFIRLDAKPMCFDLFGLFDNLYRVIQRLVFRLDPAYKTTWNERQKQISEELPFRYLRQILPGADETRSVYYRYAPPGQKAQWFEADGLVCYGDHLFVVEVKGGSFTYTSPGTDLPAHINSLRNLLQSPATQGSRFVDFLNSAPEVTLADVDHREIGRLRASDFRHVTVMAVTLDPFTELAARAQHLKQVGIDVGTRPVWAVSIDDLRVYAELFLNPLIFLHYIEQRMRAAKSSLVNLNDEFDHVGLYFESNDYVRLADQITGGEQGSLTFDGYRLAIDEFFAARLNGEAKPPPSQNLPARILEIIAHLVTSDQPWRLRMVSFLLDGDDEFRNSINLGVERLIRENRELRRLRPFSTFGEAAITICCWSPAVPRNSGQAVDFTRAAAAAQGESHRPLLELEYDETDRLVSVHWQDVGALGLSSEELDRIQEQGRALRQQRVYAASAQRKICPNEQCPCGSGVKYKKCCRP